MSEIQRWEYDPDFELIEPDESGRCVRYSDHIAEVHRLRAQLADYIVQIVHLKNTIDELNNVG